MPRVLVVCGAGASSTFLVHWMRRIAVEQGLDLLIEAGSADDVQSQSQLHKFDALLVGSHLAKQFAELQQRAANPALLLPTVPFDATGATVVIDLLRELLAASEVQHTTEPIGSHDSGSSHG